MREYSPYHKAIVKEMNILAEIPNSIFLGQQVASENFYNTLDDIPMHKRREMPVAEEMQMGISIGMSLEGYLPISIYQRMDFLPRAMDQIVNHLNLIEELSRGLYKPRVIIRTTVGATSPFNVGKQHNKDLTYLMREAVDFPVLKVTTPQEVHNAYSMAREIEDSICIIELQDLY
jgi:pyruvate dehydrogenase E1 component beta subunit